MQLRVFTLLCFIFTVIISPIYSLEIMRNGCVDKQLFEKDWRKYSDFDERIPLASRSSEVQKYNEVLDEIKECHVEIARIMVQMELDKEARMALNDYENALKKGLKTNLLKSFWRLAWITYNTVGGHTGSIGSLVSRQARRGHLYYDGVMRTGKNYAEIFDSSASLISRIGKALATVKKLIPSKYSKLPGEGGKVTNVGVEVIIEGLKNTDIDKFILKDEMAIVKMIVSMVMKGIETTGKEVMPSIDISDEELGILRTQHVELERIKKAIEDSDRAKMVRESMLEKLNAQIHQAEQKAKEWEKSEKERVFIKLNRECNNPLELDVFILAPTRIATNDTAKISVTTNGKGNKYRYVISVSGPSGQSSKSDGEFAWFKAAVPGIYNVAVYVFDKNSFDRIVGKKIAAIRVEDIGKNIVRPGSLGTPTHSGSGSSGGDYANYFFPETLTLTADKKEGVSTSRPTSRGKIYVLEASGVIKTNVYRNNGTFVAVAYDPFFRLDEEGQVLYVPRDAVETLIVNGHDMGETTYAEKSAIMIGSKAQPFNPDHVYVTEFAGDGRHIRCVYGWKDWTRPRKSIGSFTIKIYEKPGFITR